MAKIPSLNKVQSLLTRIDKLDEQRAKLVEQLDEVCRNRYGMPFSTLQENDMDEIPSVPHDIELSMIVAGFSPIGSCVSVSRVIGK